MKSKIINLKNAVAFGAKANGAEYLATVTSTSISYNYRTFNGFVIERLYTVSFANLTSDMLKEIYENSLRNTCDISVTVGMKTRLQKTPLWFLNAVADLNSGSTLQFEITVTATTGIIREVTYVNFGDWAFVEPESIILDIEQSNTANMAGGSFSTAVIASTYSVDFIADSVTTLPRLSYEITSQANVDVKDASRIYAFGWASSDEVSLQYPDFDSQLTLNSLCRLTNLENQVEDYQEDFAELVNFGEFANDVNINYQGSQSTYRLLVVRNVNTMEGAKAQARKNIRLLRRIPMNKVQNQISTIKG